MILVITNTKFVFQVETVGDKYMAVSGLPTRCSKHAVNIANLALDMIDIVQEVNAQGRKMQVTKYNGINISPRNILSSGLATYPWVSEDGITAFKNSQFIALSYL